MSWTTALDYMKGVAGRHGMRAQDERADRDLPLNARLGALVTLQVAPFLRAQTMGSLVSPPAQLQETIRAIGHVKLDFPGDIYRYYLETADDNNQRRRYIQVVADAQGQVLERMYCERLVRFVPETAQDQAAFTGEAGEGLGQKFYALSAEQLTDVGYEPHEIDAALQGQEAVTFVREAGAADAEFVRPFAGTEVRIDDAEGEHGLEQSIWFMPYVRALGGMTEYLLITTQLINSRDGDVGKREMHVELMVGIPLEAERIAIQ